MGRCWSHQCRPPFDSARRVGGGPDSQTRAALFLSLEEISILSVSDELPDGSDGLPDGLLEKPTNVYAGPDGLTGFYP